MTRPEPAAVQEVHVEKDNHGVRRALETIAQVGSCRVPPTLTGAATTWALELPLPVLFVHSSTRASDWLHGLIVAPCRR